jgi:hypothetical protein
MTEESLEFEPDAPFTGFRRDLFADFASRFDDWLRRAQDLEARGDYYASSLAALLTAPVDVDPSYPKRQADLVFDLARMCRHFVQAELFAWAFLGLRHRATPPEIMSVATAKSTALLKAVHDRKWNVGLQQLRFVFPSNWAVETWRVVVEDSMTEYISGFLLPRLERWAPHRITRYRTTRITPQLAHVFNRAVERAGISNPGEVTLHTLRHTALSRMIAAGCDDYTVMEIAGHSSTRMLARYTHPTEERKLGALSLSRVVTNWSQTTEQRAIAEKEAAELAEFLTKRWWTAGGSNSRPPRCERGALPTELAAHVPNGKCNTRISPAATLRTPRAPARHVRLL